MDNRIMFPFTSHLLSFCMSKFHVCGSLLLSFTRVSAMAANSSASVPSHSIVLRAPTGELEWTLIEIQGTLESRNGQPLDGMEFAQLKRDVKQFTAPHSPSPLPPPLFPIHVSSNVFTLARPHRTVCLSSLWAKCSWRVRR